MPGTNSATSSATSSPRGSVSHSYTNLVIGNQRNPASSKKDSLGNLLGKETYSKNDSSKNNHIAEQKNRNDKDFLYDLLEKFKNMKPEELYKCTDGFGNERVYTAENLFKEFGLTQLIENGRPKFENSLYIECEIEDKYRLLSYEYAIVRERMPHKEQKECDAIMRVMYMTKGHSLNGKECNKNFLILKSEFNKKVEPFITNKTEGEKEIIKLLYHTHDIYIEEKDKRFSNCIELDSIYACLQRTFIDSTIKNSKRKEKIKEFIEYAPKAPIDERGKKRIITLINNAKRNAEFKYNALSTKFNLKDSFTNKQLITNKQKQNLTEKLNAEYCNIDSIINSESDIAEKVPNTSESVEMLSQKLKKLEDFIDVTKKLEDIFDKNKESTKRNRENIFRFVKLPTVLILSAAVVFAPAVIFGLGIAFANPILLITGIVLVSLYYGIPLFLWSIQKEDDALRIFLAPVMFISTLIMEGKILFSAPDSSA